MSVPCQKPSPFLPPSSSHHHSLTHPLTHPPSLPSSLPPSFPPFLPQGLPLYLSRDHSTCLRRVRSARPPSLPPPLPHWRPSCFSGPVEGGRGREGGRGGQEDGKLKLKRGREGGRKGGRAEGKSSRNAISKRRGRKIIKEEKRNRKIFCSSSVFVWLCVLFLLLLLLPHFLGSLLLLGLLLLPYCMAYCCS